MLNVSPTCRWKHCLEIFLQGTLISELQDSIVRPILYEAPIKVDYVRIGGSLRWSKSSESLDLVVIIRIRFCFVVRFQYKSIAVISCILPHRIRPVHIK